MAAAAKKAEVPAEKATHVVITPPNMQTAEVRIVGIAPLCIAKFSKKAREMMREKHVAGSQAKKGKAKPARDFDDDFNQARHISTEGWDGIVASSFRNAMISACRLVGFKMTLAKLSLFVEADGFDADDAQPLVKIIGPPPEVSEMTVRNATGVADIRVRPLWREWSCVLRVRWDGDQFSDTDVINLLNRAGQQVGVGEGRPDSKASAGLGWGRFEVA